MRSNAVSRIEGGLRTRVGVRSGQPLVSVIIVVRNNRNDIEKAIGSVISQSRDLCELIVIDGASTDGTLDVVMKYSDDIDYWMSEADDGIYDAMNKAVPLAHGKYLYFLGSDDLLSVNLKSLDPLLADPHTIYYGDVRFPSGEIPGWAGPYNALRLGQRTICHQAMFYPIQAFDNDCFCTDYKISADHVFNLRCYGNKRLRFQYINHVIATFSNTGISANVIDPVFTRNRLSLIRKYLPAHIYLLYLSKRIIRNLINFYLKYHKKLFVPNR